MSKKTYDAGQKKRNELVVRLDAITELVGKINPYEDHNSVIGAYLTILSGVQASLECVVRGLKRK